VFVHTAEAAQLGICKALFGTTTIFSVGPPLSVIDPLIIGLPLSILTLVIGIAVMSVNKKEVGKVAETD
jgi:hypothetical protein